MIGKIGLLLVAIIWGTGFVWTAIALEHFGPYEIIAIRMTIAFFALLLMNIHRLKEMTRVNLVRGSFVGLLLYLGFIFQTIGLSYTTPSNNAFLTAVNIVFVPFISLILLRRTISFQSIWGALVTFVGIGFISLQSGLSNMNRGGCFFAYLCSLFCVTNCSNRHLYQKNAYLAAVALSDRHCESLSVDRRVHFW